MQLNPSMVVMLTLTGHNHHHQSTSIDQMPCCVEVREHNIEPYRQGRGAQEVYNLVGP